MTELASLVTPAPLLHVLPPSSVSALSSIMKTKHDAAKNALNNPT
jgi:hypothetical protein